MLGDLRYGFHGECSMTTWLECVFCFCWMACSGNVRSSRPMVVFIPLYPCRFYQLRQVGFWNPGCEFVCFSFHLYQFLLHVALKLCSVLHLYFGLLYLDGLILYHYTVFTFVPNNFFPLWGLFDVIISNSCFYSNLYLHDILVYFSSFYFLLIMVTFEVIFL